MPDIRSALDTKLKVAREMNPHLSTGESRTRVSFRVVSELVVPVRLRTTYIDRFIKSIHPAKRKIVRYHSWSVPILIVHEAGSEAKNGSWIPAKKLQKVWLCW